MEYKIIAKNGEELDVEIKEDAPHTYLYVYNKEEKIIASACYKKTYPIAFFYRIEIMDNNYSHLGIATKMMKIIERDCLKRNCSSIEGKYYPFGDLWEHARAFYKKNGYSIYKEDYETYVFKDLDKSILKEDYEREL